MFTHRYRYWFILLLSGYTFLNTELCEVYYYFRIDIEWYYALLTLLAITFLSWEGNRLAEPILRRRFFRQDRKIAWFFGFFATGLVLSALSVMVAVGGVGILIKDYGWKELVQPLKLNLIYAGLINLFFHLLNTIFFFFHEYREKLLEAEKLRRISAQAQLSAIRSQINPHFLFNNLNVLSGLVLKNNPEANQFIEEFSKVYRYILGNEQKELVALRQELEFVQPYLFLLRKRFDEALRVSIDIPKDYLHFRVIPVALQMVIENAIKHNVVSAARPLTIDVHVNGNNTLVVSNDLQPRQTVERSTGIGLQNIIKRYEMVCGREVVINKTQKSFVVHLPLIATN